MNINLVVLSIISLNVAIFNSRAVGAHELSQAAVYYRCYSQLVRARPNPDDSLLLTIKKGNISASEACLNLIKSAMKLDGKVLRIAPADFIRSQKILKTIQAFHMTWFSSKDFVRDETDNATTDLYDANESGYHLTYNLLNGGSRFSDILTRKNSFRGIRKSNKKNTYLIDAMGAGIYQSFIDNVWASGTAKESLTYWKPELVQFGDLIAIEETDFSKNRVNYVDRTHKQMSVWTNKNLGAGIIGSASYILLNTHQKTDEFSNGGLSSHRSWSKALLNDLLCKNLPLLNENDVTEWVQPDSSIPFRKQAACMKCHSTMDPMANVLRNVTEVRLGNKWGGNILSPRSLLQYGATFPPEMATTDNDRDFYRRPTNGKLYFRNYKNELINEKLSSLTQLGEAMAKTDDLYICAAKRYFHFFTGINVNIGRYPEASSAKKNKRDLKYIDFVIQLGLNLKKHQNLQTTVQEIINSPYYKLSDYGATL